MYALFLLLIQCICTILLSQGNYRRIFLIPSDISLRRFDAVAFLMYSRCPFPPHGSPMLAQPLFDDHSFIGEQRISMAFVCVLYVCMYSMYLPSAEPSRFEWRQEYYFRSAWAISNRSHIISTAAGVLTLRLDVVVIIIVVVVVVVVVAVIFVEVVEVVVIYGGGSSSGC